MKSGHLHSLLPGAAHDLCAPRSHTYTQVTLIDPSAACCRAVYVFPPILYSLNLWWFYKIVKGVMKLLSKPKVKTA